MMDRDAQDALAAFNSMLVDYGHQPIDAWPVGHGRVSPVEVALGSTPGFEDVSWRFGQLRWWRRMRFVACTPRPSIAIFREKWRAGVYPELRESQAA